MQLAAPRTISAPLTIANGYPNPGGTAVLSAKLQLTRFGDGAMVDHLKITGHSSPNVGGTGAYRGAKGNHKFTGTAPSGSTTVTGHSTGSITY
jgi:hypothetical protein